MPLTVVILPFIWAYERWRGKHKLGFIAWFTREAYRPGPEIPPI